MTSRFSRRRFLASTAATSVLAIPATASASREHRGTNPAQSAAGGRTRATGEQQGFVRSWASTHVEANTTDVDDVTKRVDGDGAVVVGRTSLADGYENDRIWIGAFDAAGVSWSTTIEASGGASFPNVVSRGDRYVVFWYGASTDGSGDESTVATIVDADGTVLETRQLPDIWGWPKDVVVEGDSYLVLSPGNVHRIAADLSVAAEFYVPDPEEYDAGTELAALVSLDDGYVTLGHGLSPDHRKAFWAVKLDDADGDVQWNRTYRLSKDVNAYGGARLDASRAVVVGEYEPSERRFVAVAVNADGSLDWKNVIEDRSGARFTDAVSVSQGVRAFGWQRYSVPTIATFGSDGSLLSRWADETTVGSRRPSSAYALGDDRYLVGGETNGVDAGEDVDNAAWVTRLQPNQPPTPAVSVSPSEPNATEQVTFDASETTDPDTRVSSFGWNLDDDEYAEETGETMQTRFASAGTHEVTVRATDVYGAVGSKTVSVSVGENTAPSASISASPADAVVGDEVTFEASNVSDAETSVASVEWDVDGDGEVDATGETTTASFDEPGEFEVSATLSDTAGQTATVSTTVTIGEPPATSTGSTSDAGGGDDDGGDGSGGTGDSGGGTGDNGGGTGDRGGNADGDGDDDDAGSGFGATPGFGAVATAFAVTAGALARRRREER